MRMLCDLIGVNRKWYYVLHVSRKPSIFPFPALLQNASTNQRQSKVGSQLVKNSTIIKVKTPTLTFYMVPCIKKKKEKKTFFKSTMRRKDFTRLYLSLRIYPKSLASRKEP